MADTTEMTKEAPAMPAFEQALSEAGTEVTELQSAVDDARKALTQTEGELQTQENALRRAKERRARLERMQQEVQNTRQAVEARRKAAAEAHQAGQKFLESARQQLREHVDESTRQQIDAADTALDEQRAKLKALREELPDLEQKAAWSRTQAEHHAGQMQQAKAALQGLPGRIHAAQSRLNNQQKAIEKAVAGKRWREAYLYSRDLERALGELEAAASADTEAGLLRTLDERWQAWADAADEADKHARALEERQAALKQAENDLMLHEQQRMRQIDKQQSDDRASG
ncbi:MAG: hypothetical protein GX484_12415 [Chloroflexi bacterium]|nr:hypothetical protein [Chloroflexota bacterium]